MEQQGLKPKNRNPINDCRFKPIATQRCLYETQLTEETQYHVQRGLTFVGNLVMDHHYAPEALAHMSLEGLSPEHNVDFTDPNLKPPRRYFIETTYGGVSGNSAIAIQKYANSFPPVELVFESDLDSVDSLLQFQLLYNLPVSIWQTGGDARECYCFDDGHERIMAILIKPSNLRSETLRAPPRTLYSDALVMTLYSPKNVVEYLLDQAPHKIKVLALSSSQVINKLDPEQYRKVLRTGDLILNGREDELDTLAQWMSLNDHSELLEDFTYEAIITRGSKGSFFRKVVNGKLIYEITSPGKFVPNVERTVGCGDAFLGVFLYNYISLELSAHDSMRYASDYVINNILTRTYEEFLKSYTSHVQNLMKKDLITNAA